MNEWKFNIFREFWTLNIAFQTKNTPENTFILFIFRARIFMRGEKKETKQQKLYSLFIEIKSDSLVAVV